MNSMTLNVKLKFTGFVVLLVFIIFVCCGCGKRELPMPEYPLDAAAIEKALGDAGLSWTIKSKEEWGEGRIYYNLSNTDGKEIAVISSVGLDNTRTLQINFFSETETTAPLPESDWEKAIKLAALLYGGFENDEQVYQVFQDTYNDAAVIDEVSDVISKNKKRIRWQQTINDINCFLGFHEIGSNDEKPIKEIVSLLFSNTD